MYMRVFSWFFFIFSFSTFLLYFPLLSFLLMLMISPLRFVCAFFLFLFLVPVVCPPACSYIIPSPFLSLYHHQIRRSTYNSTTTHLVHHQDIIFHDYDVLFLSFFLDFLRFAQKKTTLVPILRRTTDFALFFCSSYVLSSTQLLHAQ